MSCPYRPEHHFIDHLKKREWRKVLLAFVLWRWGTAFVQPVRRWYCIGSVRPAVLLDAASWVQSSSEENSSSSRDFALLSYHGFWLHSPKTLLDESINRGLVCAHMHSMAWTQNLRSWHSCPRWVNVSNKNTPSVLHPLRWNVATSMIGLKTCTNLTQNGEPKRYSRGRQKKVPVFRQLVTLGRLWTEGEELVWASLSTTQPSWMSTVNQNLHPARSCKWHFVPWSVSAKKDQ